MLDLLGGQGSSLQNSSPTEAVSGVTSEEMFTTGLFSVGGGEATKNISMFSIGLSIVAILLVALLLVRGK